MKIALIGATGFAGSAILGELLNRKHTVTAIVRHPEKLKIENDHLTVKKGNVLETARLATLLKGNEAVISAYNSGWSNPDIYNEYMKGASSIQEATKAAGIKRLVVVGGAGSLFIKPELQLIDTPDFPDAYRAGASAARDYLNIIREDRELEWTYLSPSIEMNEGSPHGRKGTYRTLLDQPVFDQNNKSFTTVEDLAVAIVDETEKPEHIRQRFTIGY